MATLATIITVAHTTAAVQYVPTLPFSVVKNCDKWSRTDRSNFTSTMRTVAVDIANGITRHARPTMIMITLWHGLCADLWKNSKAAKEIIRTIPAIRERRTVPKMADTNVF
jgi:hypothetical protein